MIINTFEKLNKTVLHLDVVLFHNHCRIAEEKALFEFVHPNRDEKIDNNRYESIEFKAKFDATLHGIGGYFDSHLYKDIDISLN